MRMLLFFQRRVVLFGLVILMLCSVSISQAADWLFVPSATYRLIYDNNYLLSIDRPIQIFGHILDLDAKIKYESEKNVVDFVPRVSVRRVNESQNTTREGSSEADQVPDFDREDYFFKLQTMHSTKWMDVQFNANVIRDSTELDPEQFNLFQTLATRRFWDASPTFIFQLTELSSMNIGISYSDVRYEDAGDISFLNDYSNGSAVLGISNEISGRLGFTVSFNASLLQSDSELFNIINVHNETTTYSLQGEVNYEFSETEAFTFMLGRRRTQFVNELQETNEIIGNSNYGYVADLKYSKLFQSNQWRVSAGHFVIPNGAGRLSQRDKITLGFNHQLLSALRFDVGLNVTRIEDLFEFSSSVGNEKLPFRVYSNARLGLRWTLARDWFMSVAYIFRSNHYSRPILNSESTARSNAGQLIFTYTPRKARPYEIY